MKKYIGTILRKKIDKLDKQILDLLNARSKLVLEIGKHKKKSGGEFYIPSREKEILTRITKLNKGPLPKESILNIFNEILHACRALQSKLKISYLGPEATFTHLAAVKNFGRYCNFVPAKTIADVFSEVEKGRADYGVVPIENSTEGVINHTLDMFIESELVICNELNLQIEHCLLSTETDIKKIKKVYSHTQALAQCRNWLEANLPEVQLKETNSTADAAKLAKRTKGTAAIASAVASELYDLKIIAKGIEDTKENYTRFFVIGKQFSSKPTGNDKTSIMFSIKDRVGALHDMLVPFKSNNINLTKIESRPTKKKPWEYIFFIDFIGHVEDENVKDALEKLKNQSVFVKILGSYPCAE